MTGAKVDELLSGSGDGSSDDVVESWADAEGRDQVPLVVLQGLELLLPEGGPIKVTRLGAGHSNPTFLVERDGLSWVLRRPPRPPWAPTAHDVQREYSFLEALSDSGVPVPRPFALCTDLSAIGAPFYLMEFVEGIVIRDRFPAQYSRPEDRRAVAIALAEGLADVHAVEWQGTVLAEMGRPDGYLDRQLERWRKQLEHNATREVKPLAELSEWLLSNRPETPEATLVHGDYKLDNVICSTHPPARLVAVVDWEMATLGDPLADLGLLSATYVEPGEKADPVLGFSPATAAEGCPTRAELVQAYAERSGRSLEYLRWYECFAIWKIAIIIEGGYKRYQAGSTTDPFFAHVEEGMPRIAERALRHARGAAL